MHKLLILAPLLLTACAPSAQELAQQAPTESFNTSAKLVTIRECLIQQHPHYLTVLPLGDNGWRVTPQAAGPANFIVDLTPTAQGTHVEARLAKAPLHVFWDQDVAPCLDKLPRL